MRILYLSDFNCPYSYIGLNRIADTTKDLGLDVDWQMRAFELEPDADGSRAVDRFAEKNEISAEEALRQIREIEKIGQSEGLIINLQDMTINSSKDAHRLVMHVQNKHPEASQELVFRIFEANFTGNENISDTDVLVRIASSCGLDETETEEFIKSDSLKIEVELDMDEAISNGITSIPYYFIEHNNERLIVPGVFERKSFRIAIEDLLSGDMKSKTFI